MLDWVHTDTGKMLLIFETEPEQCNIASAHELAFVGIMECYTRKKGGCFMQSMYIQPSERQAVIDYFESKTGRKVTAVARYCYDYYTVTDNTGAQWNVKAR